MAHFGYVDLFIDPNPNTPEGCGLRYKAESPPRPVRVVRHWLGAGEDVVCDVVGWASEGGGSPCVAHGCTVEDSSSGAATLVYGSDWGLRLTPRNGSPAFGEPYLLLGAEDILE
jgi:hypothetical protein